MDLPLLLSAALLILPLPFGRIIAHWKSFGGCLKVGTSLPLYNLADGRLHDLIEPVAFSLKRDASGGLV